MSELIDLAEMENPDEELVPEILSVDARLGIKGPVSSIIPLFERASSVTPVKEVIVGTAYALLEAVQTGGNEAAHVRMTATDGDQTVSVVADGITVLMAGAVLVPAKRILDILKLAPTQNVRIEVLGSSAIIRSGRAQWTVQTPVGDNLPPLPDVSSIGLSGVLRTPLLEALVVARRAASSNSARLSLMQIQIRDQSVTALDGGRLHRQYIEGFDRDLQLSIPIKVVDELIRALRKSDSEYIDIGGNDFHLVFRIDQDFLIAQRLLVQFPDVESLLLGPAFSNQNSLTVDPSQLAAAVKRVRVNADPDYAGIFLGLNPVSGPKDAEGNSQWSMSVKSYDRSGNTAQEILDCQWAGPAKGRELCVNHKFLSDLLESFSGEFLTFKIGDDTKSTRNPLFVEDPEGFTAFIQQMRPDFLRQ